MQTVNFPSQRNRTVQLSRIPKQRVSPSPERTADGRPILRIPLGNTLAIFAIAALFWVAGFGLMALFK